MGVNGVSATGGAYATTQVATVQPNGTIEIDFNGKKVTVSKSDAEKFMETYNKLNYPSMRIAELEEKQAEALENNEKLDEDDAKELAELKTLLKNQRETASFEVSSDGSSVVFKLKKDINVEEFKKLFNVETGVFRERFKKDALHDGVYAGESRTYSKDGEAYLNYDDAWMAGVTEFENGVKLVEEPDGHFYPDYSGVSLQKGDSYTISEDDIDLHSDQKPWYQFW